MLEEEKEMKSSSRKEAMLCGMQSDLLPPQEVASLQVIRWEKLCFDMDSLSVITLSTLSLYITRDCHITGPIWTL